MECNHNHDTQSVTINTIFSTADIDISLAL